MGDDLSAMFTAAVEVAEQVSFSFDEPGDHINELEDHLIEKTADEIEHLGGDAEPWRFDL